MISLKLWREFHQWDGGMSILMEGTNLTQKDIIQILTKLYLPWRRLSQPCQIDWRISYRTFRGFGQKTPSWYPQGNIWRGVASGRHYQESANHLYLPDAGHLWKRKPAIFQQVRWRVQVCPWLIWIKSVDCTPKSYSGYQNVPFKKLDLWDLLWNRNNWIKCRPLYVVAGIFAKVPKS